MEHKPILGHPAPCNAQKSPCHCRLEDGDKQDVWEKGELGNTCSVPCFFPPTADTGAVRGVLLKIKEKHTHRFEGREHKDVQDTHTHICCIFLMFFLPQASTGRFTGRGEFQPSPFPCSCPRKGVGRWGWGAISAQLQPLPGSWSQRPHGLLQAGELSCGKGSGGAA